MLYKLTALLLYILFFSCIACAQQKPFTLSGTIQGKTGVFIYLGYPDDASGTYKIDSSLIINGQFSFKGTLYGPAAEGTVSLNRKGGMNDTTVRLFLVPGQMQLTLNYHNFQESVALKGSPVQVEAEALAKNKALILAQRKVLSDANRKAYAMYKAAEREQKDEAIVNCLKEASDGVYAAMYPLDKELNKIDFAFMDQYPTSFITAYRLRYLVGRMPLAKAKERYNKLPEDIRNSSVGKSIKVELDKIGRAVPGVEAFRFASTELRGGPLKLSDYKGKYVLLDFWASWCVPCRKSNPHLLSLYANYKDKGLEIIGIASDDSNPQAWRTAVEKDGIGVWKHVLRGLKRAPAGSNDYYDLSSDISEQYGIKTLPTKILIDPKGMIISRYSADGETDEALDIKLAELFGG